MGGGDVRAQARRSPTITLDNLMRDPRLQQDPARRLREEDPRPRAGDRQVARPSAGRCSRSTATTSPRSTRRSTRRRPPRGGPTFIVAHTVKGKGVSFMENNPEWHGKAPKPAEAVARDPRDPRGQRGRLGRLPGRRRRHRAIVDELRALGRSKDRCRPRPRAPRSAKRCSSWAPRDERIVTLDADLSKSTMTVELRQEVSRRARSTSASPSPNMIGVGAGLALAGQHPLRVLLRLLRGGPLRDDPHLGRLHQRQREARRHPRRHRHRRGRLQPDGAGGHRLPARAAEHPDHPARRRAGDQAGGRLRGRAPRARSTCGSPARTSSPCARRGYRFQFGRWPTLRAGHAT